MNLIKRFAFWPLLALIAMTIASAASNPVNGSTAGQVVGLTASVPLAFLIDRRRRRAR